MFAKEDKEIFDHAMTWTKQSGEMIKQSFAHKLTIQSKTTASDLVTNMDKQIEQFFVDNIKQLFPEHRVLGEEGFGDQVDSLDGNVWIIDPIDGTTNFINQKKHFAVSVAMYQNGIGKIGIIYDVATNDIYHCIAGQGAYRNEEKLPPLQESNLAQSLIGLNARWVTKNRRIDPEVLSPLVRHTRGIRSYGSAAIEMAYVATGKLGGYISLRLAPWDIAAGMLLINEVGGKTTNLDGQPINLLAQNTVLCANPFIHKEILHEYVMPKLGSK